MIGGLLLFPASAHAEKDYIGADEYRTSCLACHGADGRGNGPTAQYLKVKPSDLTKISKNNGGSFPFAKIMRIIDGRDKKASIRLHGSAMPLWGSRYRYEAVLSGENPGYSELLAGIRILKLVIYIQSIQQK
jgi:mono/diheme cytochrome c family protein